MATTGKGKNTSSAGKTPATGQSTGKKHPSDSHQYPIERSLYKILSPFPDFIRNQTTSSLLLLTATLLALVIANTPVAELYERILHTQLGFIMGSWNVSMSVSHWINEGLMALFFFLLGMEMKREMLVGEINNFKFMALVLAGALGGMLIPASIYFAFNIGTDYTQGWGIPMATDTAFAIGVLALLGARMPPGAFAFLTALAIIDDLGAITIIALFYSDDINASYLSLSALMMCVLGAMNIVGIRKPVLYIFAGVVLWLFMLGSGIHATVAGVLIALCIPARPKLASSWFVRRAGYLLRRFERIERHKSPDENILADSRQHEVADSLKEAVENATTPLRRWEKNLDHPVGLFVLPIFALANAGVSVSTESFSEIWQHPLALGIIGGLVIGKGIGIPLFVYLALKLRLGSLSKRMNMNTVIGLGLLGGVGFTMSIFITGLGFGSEPGTMNIAKSAVLIASFIAGSAGYLWLRLSHPHPSKVTENT